MQRLADFLTLGRWRVYYLAIACVGLIGIGERLVRPWEGNFDYQGEPLSSDFSTFYAAAHVASEGAANVYDPAVLAEAHARLIGPPPGATNTGSFFLNPPTFLLLVTPFAVLPYPAAAGAWLFFSLLLLGLCALLIERELKPGPRLGTLWVLGCLFVPTQVALTLGQNTALTLALSCAAFFALRRKRDFASGLFVGLLVLKPQLGLGFALIFLGGRRWKAIAAAALSASLLTLMSYAAFPQTWSLFLQSIADSSDYVRGLTGTFPVHMSTSVPAALDLLLQPLGKSLPVILGAVFLFAVTALVLRRFLRLSWEPGTRTWDLSVAATLGLTWMSSPHLLLYDVTLFLLPAAIAAAHLRKPDRPFGGRVFSAWTFLAVLAASLWIQLVLARMQTWQAANGGPRVLPQLVTVALVGWSWLLWRASEPTGSPETSS